MVRKSRRRKCFFDFLEKVKIYERKRRRWRIGKGRSRKCFNILEKVKNYERERRWRIGKVDEGNALMSWKK